MPDCREGQLGWDEEVGEGQAWPLLRVPMLSPAGHKPHSTWEVSQGWLPWAESGLCRQWRLPVHLAQGGRSMVHCKAPDHTAVMTGLGLCFSVARSYIQSLMLQAGEVDLLYR